MSHSRRWSVNAAIPSTPPRGLNVTIAPYRSAEQARRHRVVRVRGEARVAHPLDPRVGLEERRERGRIR